MRKVHFWLLSMAQKRFMSNFVAFFVASGTALLRRFCNSEGKSSPNLLFSAILPEQNLNFAQTLGVLLSKTSVIP